MENAGPQAPRHAAKGRLPSCAPRWMLRALPETGRRLGEQGFQVNALDSVRFAAFIGTERAKWSKLVQDLRIEPK